MLQTLFKRAKNGKIQQWTIEVVGDSYRTKEGYLDGAQTYTEWTSCNAKSIGKKNATTAAEQAIKEAEAKVKKQKDKGWAESAAEVDVAAVKVSPMLAHKWDDHKDYATSQNVLGSQPKLDGIRCYATKDGLFTRNGKLIVAAPHIWMEAKSVLEGFPDGVAIDGELYNHDLKEDFNRITSIVRKQNVSKEDLEESRRLLQYHVYDIDVKNTVFASRNAIVQGLLADNDVKYMVVVETSFVQKDDSQTLDALYAKYREEGYEGQMIRVANSNYENGRSKNLLKRKEFQDDEFIIVDIEEGVGNRSGMMGRIKFENFDANARGTHEYFKELLANKHLYVGQKATVRYQNLTPDGIPRFPVVVNIGRID